MQSEDLFKGTSTIRTGGKQGECTVSRGYVGERIGSGDSAAAAE